MSKKIFLLIFIFFGIIFCHFYNKHKIMIDSRKCEELQEQLKSYREQNYFLITENCRLCSRERIQMIARKELGMIYPQNPDNIYTIKIDDKKNSFCLIDFIVPSVEALTK
ncbi:MAG: hypothetical protein APR54_11730 [Candidatus Cloacimonas sp. SDB]|nr:MAG: hypothetical protein APR54_11730 [Candidatus Cloacimonas sp. SDB]